MSPVILKSIRLNFVKKFKYNIFKYNNFTPIFMTNYLGEESDLDEFLALEQQIFNEDPAQLRKYAMMYKTKSP